jgi:hypothetical protein
VVRSGGERESTDVPKYWINEGATMIRFALIAFGMLITTASAEPLTTFRNDKGQVTGYSEWRGNTTTFSNERGQSTGRAERQRDGTTIFYDSMGRMIGSSKDRR